MGIERFLVQIIFQILFCTFFIKVHITSLLLLVENILVSLDLIYGIIASKSFCIYNVLIIIIKQVINLFIEFLLTSIEFLSTYYSVTIIFLFLLYCIIADWYIRNHDLAFNANIGTDLILIVSACYLCYMVLSCVNITQVLLTQVLLTQVRNDTT